MKHYLVWVRGGIAAAAIAFSGNAMPLAAQEPGSTEVFASAAVNTQASENSEIWSRLATVKVNDVSLKTALKMVAQSGRVEVMYRNELVEAAKPVSIDVKNTPLNVVFSEILKGTGLQAVMSTPGVIAIKRMANQPHVVQGTVVGKIINAKTKQPVVGATVTIDGTSISVVSGQDGAYRISVSAGEHTLRIRAVGFVLQTKTVSVTDNETRTIDVVLQPSASVLDEVIVTGTVVATERREIAHPVTVITAEDIERRGITQIDQLFRGEVPGVYALDPGVASYVDDFSTGITSSLVYARGSASLNGDANPLKTYVDGVELLDASYLASIDPRSIERIEIITGPQAATIYGSGALGGVMQIFTKRGNDAATPTVTLDLSMGSMQSNFSNGFTPLHRHGLGVTGGVGAAFSYSANASYEYSGQWQPFLYSRSYGASIGLTHTAGNFRVGGSLSLSLRRRANGTYAYAGRLACGGTPNNCTVSPLERIMEESGKLRRRSRQLRGASPSQRVARNRSQNESVNFDYRLGPLAHHLSLGRNELFEKQDPRAPTHAYPHDSLYATSRSAGYRVTVDYNSTASISRGLFQSTLTLGGTGGWVDESQSDGCYEGRNPASIIPCGSLLTVSQSPKTYSYGGFGSLRFGVGNRVFLTAGMRGEKNANYGAERQINWTPTLGLSVNSDIHLLTMKIYGSYGKATRPPSAGFREQEVYTQPLYHPSISVLQLANPYLQPEYSHGSQFGLELYYGNLVSLTVNRYQQHVTDLIQRVRVDSVSIIYVPAGTQFYLDQWQYVNGGKMRQKGWEGTMSVSFGLFNVKGTYAWTDSRIIYMNENVEYLDRYGAVGKPFNGLPTHSGSLSASFADREWSILFVSNFVGTTTEEFSSPGVNNSNDRVKMYGLRTSLISGVERERPAYSKSDLSASRRISDVVSLSLRMQNVFNRTNSDFGEWFPALGRQTLFGLSLRYR